jgi:hypothetical protein
VSEWVGGCLVCGVVCVMYFKSKSHQKFKNLCYLCALYSSYGGNHFHFVSLLSISSRSLVMCSAHVFIWPDITDFHL